VIGPSRLRASAAARAHRLSASRPQLPGVDTLFQLYERDEAMHGSIFASAVAFRLFLWMLPLSLAVVAGLGFLRAGGNSPEKALNKVGVSAISASSIADGLSSSSSSHWWAAVVGIVFLYPTSVALAKVVHRAHAVAWGDERTKLRSKWRAAAFVLVTGAAVLVLTGVSARVRALSGPGLVVRLGLVAAYTAGWLGVSRFLPHRDAPWAALVPGAVLFGVGNAALHFFTVVYVAHRLASATRLYGTLGSAAALLSFLYLLGRLVVASATLNASLWDRHLAGATSPFARLRRHH